MNLLFLFLLCFFYTAKAQKSLLQSGPMVGYSTMKEVLLWVQTKSPANVRFIYHEKGKADSLQSTREVLTEEKNAFVAKLVARVQPGKKYTYRLLINQQEVAFEYPLEFQSQTLWQWRTDPPAFKFVFGSCNYVNEPEVDRPGTPYGRNHQIFEAIYQQKPDFMLWGGDNTYLREVDWNTRSGILYRHTHTRSLPVLQPLLASAHHYATWDDHDYGPNNSDRSYWMKETTKEAFELFWGNPHYGAGGGISGTFFWNDVQFFMLDNRYFKAPNYLKDSTKALLGEEQLQWLIDGLTGSKARFKFVVIGGQVLNPVIESWTESYAMYPGEQKKLFEAIREQNIPGVIFLSGDRHHTELSMQSREGTYPLYDVTVSPFTAGGAEEKGKDEANVYRVPDTYYGYQNFALMTVSGKRKERVLTIQIMDVDGKEIWKKEIRANDLR